MVVVGRRQDNNKLDQNTSQPNLSIVGSSVLWCDKSSVGGANDDDDSGSDAKYRSKVALGFDPNRRSSNKKQIITRPGKAQLFLEHSGIDGGGPMLSSRRMQSFAERDCSKYQWDNTTIIEDKYETTISTNAATTSRLVKLGLQRVVHHKLGVDDESGEILIAEQTTSSRTIKGEGIFKQPGSF